MMRAILGVWMLVSVGFESAQGAWPWAQDRATEISYRSLQMVYELQLLSNLEAQTVVDSILLADLKAAGSTLVRMKGYCLRNVPRYEAAAKRIEELSGKALAQDFDRMAGVRIAGLEDGPVKYFETFSKKLSATVAKVAKNDCTFTLHDILPLTHLAEPIEEIAARSDTHARASSSAWALKQSRFVMDHLVIPYLASPGPFDASFLEPEARRIGKLEMEETLTAEQRKTAKEISTLALAAAKAGQKGVARDDLGKLIALYQRFLFPSP